MATQADLDAALTTLDTDIAALITEQGAAFKRLEALIAAGAPPADLSKEVADITARNADLAAALAVAQKEGQPPAPVTPPAP